jgi:hypothetical protein
MTSKARLSAGLFLMEPFCHPAAKWRHAKAPNQAAYQAALNFSTPRLDRVNKTTDCLFGIRAGVFDDRYSAGTFVSRHRRYL